jgi:hypothetical protein
MSRGRLERALQLFFLSKLDELGIRADLPSSSVARHEQIESLLGFGMTRVRDDEAVAVAHHELRILQRSMSARVDTPHRSVP